MQEMKELLASSNDKNCSHQFSKISKVDYEVCEPDYGETSSRCEPNYGETFSTPELNRTAFSLLNAGARYNRVAHDAEVEAGDGCQNYVDDTLGKSKDKEEHLDLLRRIFQSYCSHGLLIHPAKTRLY